MSIKKFLLYFIAGTIILTIAKLIAPNSFTCGWFGGVLFYASMQLVDLNFEDDKTR